MRNQYNGHEDKREKKQKSENKSKYTGEKKKII